MLLCVLFLNHFLVSDCITMLSLIPPAAAWTYILLSSLTWLDSFPSILQDLSAYIPKINKNITWHLNLQFWIIFMVNKCSKAKISLLFFPSIIITKWVDNIHIHLPLARYGVLKHEVRALSGILADIITLGREQEALVVIVGQWWGRRRRHRLVAGIPAPVATGWAAVAGR